MDSWSFAEEVKLTPINLPRAALQFARELAYPYLDVSAYMTQLRILAETAYYAAPAGQPPLVRAELLAKFLFQDQGFRGDTADYGNPRNSFLNDVLDRRIGIPISLSLLYLAIAERIGITAFGVGLPGHFIVGVQNDDQVAYFDPFHRGQRLTLADCAQLVRQTTGYDGAFQPEWLKPVTNEQILARMLNNLRLIYVGRNLWSQALAVLKLLRQIQPDVPQYERDMGLIYLRLGEIRQAAFLLEEYLQEVPNAPDADAIRRGVRDELQAWVRLN